MDDGATYPKNHYLDGMGAGMSDEAFNRLMDGVEAREKQRVANGEENDEPLPPAWCFSGSMPRRTLPMGLKKFVYPWPIYIQVPGKPIMHPMWNSYFSGNFSPPKSRRPMKVGAEVQQHARRCRKVYDLQGRKVKQRRPIPASSWTGYTEERIGTFDRVMAASTTQELEQDALEAARLIRSQQEWREIRCLPDASYFENEGEDEKHEGNEGSFSK